MIDDLPNYIVDEDDWLRLTSERYRYRYALAAIAHLNENAACACKMIARAALDGEA